MALVSTLAISPVNLEDSGLYTCQSGFNSEANVTVIVISGKNVLNIPFFHKTFLEFYNESCWKNLYSGESNKRTAMLN